MKHPSHTPDPQWTSRYAKMITSAQEAVRHIKPGQRVFLATGAGVPRTLVRALIQERSRLADIEVILVFVAGEFPLAVKELSDTFTINTFFVADNVRPMVGAGLADHTPILMSDIPRLFSSNQLPIDVAMIQVTPPDLEGEVNLGVAVDVVRCATENASLVLAQVNTAMPRTHGDSNLSVWDLDLLIPAEDPLPEMHLPAPDEALERIGPQIAALVPDGATIQMGLGRSPQLAIRYLTGKKNLCIHTEMISDTVLELIAAGAILAPEGDGDHGQIVTSFALGSRKLYDAVHDAPIFSFRRTEYVNDVRNIARQQRMVAINGALQVDLTGQVCVDSLGTHFYSGIGGILDFNTGASNAVEGRSIIVLPATARKGRVSRIVDQLTPGAGVALNRGVVHYVVSEFGVAYLFGKTIQERAIALIGIAHPDHRARLLKRAVKLGFVRPEIGDVDGQTWVGGRELRTSMLLENGQLITFRSSRPTDWKPIKKMLYSLSEGTVYRRFMSHVKRFPFNRIKNFTFIDQRRDVVVVGVITDGKDEWVVSIGGYNVEGGGANRAEVAFLVRDEWQGQGIGTFMMRHLANMARNAGLSGLTAETLMDNRPMQAVLEKCGFSVHTRVDGDTVHFDIDF
ncbi:butyrate:acetyl-CoA coenzyme A-transferase [Candidatus Magnetaquicoccaceae bacterium FCR-1]|uniref:Butyrate:acetyl-CoA coenzyme A-transferase n=1 Tax=Candidatus Magnetaquiglobus chichijimensis TaxID=3141448 RepID=A0ABQ0C9N2_9PROT